MYNLKMFKKKKQQKAFQASLKKAQATNFSLQNYQTFVFDLDGTLLNDQFLLSLATIKLIAKLKNDKKQIIINTGRSHLFLEALLAPLNLESPIVTLNGAVITSPKEQKTLFYKSINHQLLKKLINLISPYETLFYLHYYLEKATINALKKPEDFDLYDFYEDQTLVAKVKYQKDLALPALVFGLEIMTKKQSLLKTLEAFCQNETLKCQTNLETLMISNENYSKGQALKWLASKNYLNLETTLAFGDYYNDWTMHPLVDLVIMQNAPQELKKAAFKVTSKTNNEDGIVAFFKKYY